LIFLLFDAEVVIDFYEWMNSEVYFE